MNYNISQTKNNNITNNEYLANIFNIKDFNNNQTHTQNIPSPELNIIKKCGFNSFDEVILRINGLSYIYYNFLFIIYLKNKLKLK